MLLLLLLLGANAATRVALPTGTDMHGWEDAAARAGVELAANASADVLVIATPDAWYLRVVALDLEAKVDPPRTNAEREALLTLAGSLARPVGAPRARTAPVEVTAPPAPSPAVATAVAPRPTAQAAPRPTPTVAPRSIVPTTDPSVARAAPRPTTPPVAPPGESPPVAPRSTLPVETPAIAPAPPAPAPAVAPAAPIAAAPLVPGDAAAAAPLLPAVVPLPTFPVETPVIAPALAAPTVPPPAASVAAPATPSTPLAPATEVPRRAPPTETRTVTPAPTQPRFYPALSVGVAARTDGALAAQVGASVGWAARPWLRFSVDGGYTSSAPLPAAIADGRMSAAELGASLEVGERWFARAGAAATLAWFTQDGADRGTAAWPSLHIAGGYALPTGPIVFAPEIGLHGDLAEASLLVGETAAATLPPLRVELRLTVRTR